MRQTDCVKFVALENVKTLRVTINYATLIMTCTNSKKERKSCKRPRSSERRICDAPPKLMKRLTWTFSKQGMNRLVCMMSSKTSPGSLI